MATELTTAPAAGRSVARLRPIASAFLSPAGDGSRRRSPFDVFRLILAFLVVAALGAANGYSHYLFGAVTRAVYPPPHVVDWVIGTMWLVGCVGSIVLLAVSALMSRRIVVFRDVVVAALLSFLVCVGIQSVVGVRVGLPTDVETYFKGIDLGFPVPLLAITAGVIFVSLPYLSRALQRLIECTLAVTIISGFVNGSGLPFSLLAAVAAGWGVAAVIHLAFGSPVGVPSVEDVLALLEEMGHHLTDVTTVPHQQWGVTRFVANGAESGSLGISLYSRDARHSQLMAKLYRTFAFRNDTAPFALTRVQQIEHEAYLTLLAERAAPGGTATLVETKVVGPSHQALVVTAQPPGDLLATVVADGRPVSREALIDLASAVSRLGAGGMAHGAISFDSVLITATTAGLVNFDRAAVDAGELAVHVDIASLMVVMALATDAATSADVATSVFGTDVVAAVLPVLETAVLTPLLQSSVRGAHDRHLLKDLRVAGASAAGVEVPELEDLKRFSWSKLLVVVGSVIGGWALIGTLVHAAGSASVIRNAQVGWVIVVAVLSTLAFFGSAVSTLGTVTAPLPFFPLLMLELSNTFAVLTVSGAVTAARIRFFQRQGMDPTVSVSSGMLMGTAGWIVKGVMLLIAIPLASGTLNVSDLLKSSGVGNVHVNSTLVLWIVVAVLVLIGIVVFVVAKVPKTRAAFDHKVVPHITALKNNLNALASEPRKLVELVSGQLVGQLAIALSLSAALQAFGQHLSLAAVLVVLTFSAILGNVSPVPGGMGVVEAGMTLCLKACGVPSDQAIAAVFVQRLFTGYLPPVGGWLAMVWLRKKEYL